MLRKIMNKPIFGPVLGSFGKIIVAAKVADGGGLNRNQNGDRC